MNPAYPPLLALTTIGESISGRLSQHPIVLLVAVGLFVILGSIITWKVSMMFMKLTLVLVILIAVAGAAWWHFVRSH